MSEVTGYLSSEFGQSLASLGEVIVAPHSRLQLIKRRIDADHFDLVGLYPYCMVKDWRQLPKDQAFLAETGAVSLVFVADPFAAEDVAAATKGWTLNAPFKAHCIVDLRTDWWAALPKNLRNYSRRGLRMQTLSIEDNPTDLVDSFWSMHCDNLVRKNETGIRRLSKSIIAKQLAVPGSLVIAARDDEGISGLFLCFQHGPTANGHLIAITERGYAKRATYALYYSAFSALAERGVSLVNLGGGPGVGEQAKDSLFRFKRRWASETRLARICGNILQPETYDLLSGEVRDESDYFPAYRRPGSVLEWQPLSTS